MIAAPYSSNNRGPQSMEVAAKSLVRSVSVYRAASEYAQEKWFGNSTSPYKECMPPQRELIQKKGDGPKSLFIHESPDGLATITWPCLSADVDHGFVQFHCDPEHARGAFEIWQRSDRNELGLTSSWYANLDRLKQISQFIKFPRRAGLPGMVWEGRFPRVLGALSDSKKFVRVAAARSERLVAALGVPFMRQPPQLDAVLLLLNTAETPIARVIEVWARHPETSTMKIVSADYGSLVDLAPISRKISLRRGEGIAGHVYEHRGPWLTQDLLGVEFPRGERFEECGLGLGVGIPVFIGEDLVACVNLYW